MLKSSLLASRLFQCLYTSHGSWLVVLLPDNASSKSINPKMKHVRTVILFDNKLTYYCPEITVYGLPCRHILHVASAIPNFTRPTHHDGYVRWWKVYYYYDITENLITNTDRTIQKMLNFLKT